MWTSKGKQINLFGEKLLLHERRIKDAFQLDDIFSALDSTVSQNDISLSIQTLLDGLKLNLERCSIKYPLWKRGIFRFGLWRWSF